ncbi:MAG: MlaD family protein [Deltaproteobacteria bacterium]|nr:MlaD family protein [Deltaproteobacteria bacterium]
MSKKVEVKVGLFVVITSVLIIASVLYLAYSKGFFTREYIYTLSSKSGEDLTEGMPVLFSGYKIGRVETLELNDQGILLIKIRIPEQHSKWIRSNSTFSLYKPLIGSSRLIIATENLNSPALSPKTIPEIVMVNDINETIKKVQPTLAKVDKVVTNIERITANLADPQGNVNKILSHSEKLTGNLAKKDTIIEMATGTPESAKSVNESLKKIRDLLAKTDDQVYGNDGALPLVRKILKDIILKLEKINTALDNVVKISADASDSTKDLKLLRTEIDTTVNSIGKLVNDIDKILPSKKEPEIKLP